MKRVLITGGCGFIGSNLAKYLLNKGFDVSIVDNLSTGHRDNIKGLDVSLFVKDLCESVDELEEYDAVVHLAAFTSVIDSNIYPPTTWRNNVESTFNILEFCRQKGIRNFIFASSSAVNGDSIYGATKSVGESLCNSYSKYGIRSVCLRFANVYGKNSKNDSVIPILINKIKNQDYFKIYGDGKQTRDFVNVLDICQAIHLAIGKGSGIYEVGTCTETSINDLVAIMSQISGKSIRLKYEPIRVGEILNSVADISKAHKELGYIPQVKLEDGLKELWKEKS